MRWLAMVGFLWTGTAFAAGPEFPPSQAAPYEGQWVGVDKDGWVYELKVSSKGKFSQVVNQTDQKTKCKQKGKFWESEGQIHFWYQSNKCNTDYNGQTASSPLVRHQDGLFEIDMSSYTIVYKLK